MSLSTTRRLLASADAELWQLARHPITNVIPFAMALAGIVVGLLPVLVNGVDQTLGAFGWQKGLEAGSVVACVVGPMLILIVSGGDMDSGMRRAKFLTGTPGAIVGGGQLIAVLASLVAIVLCVGVSTFVVGVSDLAFRALTNAPTHVVRQESVIHTLAASGSTLLSAAALTVVVWCLVHATRSGMRATLLIAGLLSTWFGLLLRVRSSGPRQFLCVHPLSFPWHIFDPFPAEALTAPHPTLSACVFAVWAAVLVIASWFGVSRAGLRG